jgi:hypothetical protein
MAYSNQFIDNLLELYKPVIGVDTDRYKNHVYRVFLNCLLMDADQNNEEKYAIAAVFHDIGIWTNHTIDYLDPSIVQARNYLTKAGKQEWFSEIKSMINLHHKTSRYHGEYGKTIETFRKADWIDVSLGLLTFGYNKQIIKENQRLYPNLGFHLFLAKEISKNFLRHPLNPLPMFRN